MYEVCQTKFSYEAFAMTTDRLRLSVYRKSRAREVTSYLSRNRAFHKQWSQTHDDSYYKQSVQRDYLHYDLASYRKGHIVPLWITLKDNPNEVIGKVSYFNFAYGGMMSCALGYHLDEKHLHKGYITEAVTESMKMLVELMNIHRIEAFILPENEASLAVVERCGFMREGVRYSYMHINGRWRDHISFFILDDAILKKT